MGKKQQRNAFWYFMKEEEPKLRKEGRVFPNGMADMAVVCHPRYKALPQKDRERFENMARQYKAKMRGIEGDKVRLDNQGDVVAYRSNKHTDLGKRRMQEKKIMKKNWPVGKDLAKEKFYFISFQILCHTEDGHFLPCEIGMIEYSLEKGISKHLHQFIEPGRIPTGYRFACIEHSQDTHKIPVENFDQANSNYLGLWNQIENFINPNGEREEYPPLYCLSAGENYKMVEYCLEWIHANAFTGRQQTIRHVFAIEDLLVEIFANIGKDVSKSMCISMLTTSDYDYEPNTKCSFHEELEVKECALGIVNRFAYAISNANAELYEFELTKDHVPMREKLASMTIKHPENMPPFKNQPFSAPPKSMDMGFKPRKKVVEVEEEEEEDYVDLRLPKTHVPYGGAEPSSNVAWAGAMGGAIGGVMGGASQNNFRPVGRGQSVQYNNDFPAYEGAVGRGFDGFTPAPLGRGMTQGMNLSNRHAGYSAPPPPSAAPDPPTSWKQQPVNVGFPQQPIGVGRGMLVLGKAPGSQVGHPPGFLSNNGPFNEPNGMSSRNGTMNQPPGFTNTAGRVDDYEPLRLPGQAAPPRNNDVMPNKSSNTSASAPDPSPAPKLKLGRGCGRGYGGILEGILEKGGTLASTPKGRGYAPPDWVDDGGFGPVRR